jgi:hypothetical protein
VNSSNDGASLVMRSPSAERLALGCVATSVQWPSYAALRSDPRLSIALLTDGLDVASGSLILLSQVQTLGILNPFTVRQGEVWNVIEPQDRAAYGRQMANTTVSELAVAIALQEAAAGVFERANDNRGDRIVTISSQRVASWVKRGA